MEKVHFVSNYLLNPTNPVTVNLIGAGGTGSVMITVLGRINNALLALDHPGLDVRLFDGDTISKNNTKRQLFSESEVGLPKSTCLINRVNRFWGTGWKAFAYHYTTENKYLMRNCKSANITISCVDKVQARFEIAEILRKIKLTENHPDRCIYWLDLGNSRYTGQSLIGTVHPVRQPTSKLYEPTERLPFVTEEYRNLLLQTEETDKSPSCSAAEALAEQDLFINPAIATMAGRLLMNMFTEGVINVRGFFMNIEDYQMQPITVNSIPLEFLNPLSVAA
ncbi:PRTRC system ThiF family protein [Chitinophaga rhizophila]|uniref:PRTRC system ThiF family protein n=1 Tax=Chitinophaga rhizophila TaxID=2866212 RepID=A0ABS7G9V4_9BACT|nr:PRTRC system ThiF family protein [Chitinophaga rhizophila]MBW8683507.1 PRTRC system ThiF family protein [Chitinophaga rhizophila]